MKNCNLLVCEGTRVGERETMLSSRGLNIGGAGIIIKKKIKKNREKKIGSAKRCE